MASRPVGEDRFLVCVLTPLLEFNFMSFYMYVRRTFQDLVLVFINGFWDSHPQTVNGFLPSGLRFASQYEHGCAHPSSQFFRSVDRLCRTSAPLESEDGLVERAIEF